MAMAASLSVAHGVEVDPLAPAKNIYFIGNSYTGNGNLYTYVGALATEAGWQTPTLMAATNGGSTLSDSRPVHKNNIQNGSNGSDWDVVVLQEQSQRPSAPSGTSENTFFYTGALDWYDHTLRHNPNAQVVMYQTWARHPDAESGTYYPNYYFDVANPAEMQSRVSTHYAYVADTYIPTHSTAADKTDVRVARVGDAWAENYAEIYSGGMPLRLHAGDGSHQNSEGIYLAALILYSEIYLTGIDEITTNAGVNGVDAAEAAHLRDIAARMIPAAYTRIEGDANDDGIVDLDDLAFVNGNLGISTKRLYNGDLNADGLVNSLDIGIVQNAITPPRTVTYDGNTADLGSAPTDSASPYLDGASVTVLGNTGQLTKAGYDFAGWNTAANGTGDAYSPGDTFNIAANTTFYAQWVANTTPRTITYLANTADSGDVPTDPNSPYVNGSTVTVLGNTGALAKADHVFIGWNTAANGSGSAYNPGDTIGLTQNIMLYAQWIEGSYCAVNYQANGADSGSAPTDASSPYLSGAGVTVLGNTGGLVRAGYTFIGWNTASDGSGTSYQSGDTFSIPGSVTLYAQWNVHPTVDPIANRTIELQETPGSGGTSVVLASLDEESEGWVTETGISVTLDQFSWRSLGTSTDGTFGSAFTGAATGATGALRSTKTAEFPRFTFTNNTGQDVVFDKIHFDLQDLVVGASTFTLTYTSGDLGIPNGTVITTVSPTANTSPVANFPDFNISLTGLSDFTLANGHSASFEFSSNTPTEQFLLDNIAFSGTIGSGAVLSATTQLVGSASDGEADPMTYAWTVVSSPAGSQATFTAANALQTDATFDKEGVYVLRLTATDSFGGSGYREVTITVVPAGSSTLTVIYDGNGADSGVIPSDGNSPYAASSSVTVLGNTGSLVRSGFRFEGWGTSLSGGTLYQPGDSFTISANTTLYAQWGAVTTNHSVPNAWLSARNPSWSSDYEAAALADHDGDGIPTWKEYWLGTDPLDPDSSFKIDSVTISGGNVTLRWNHAAVDVAIPDIVIESSPDLSPGSWTEVGSFTPVDGENTWSATLPEGDAFYRLRAIDSP